MPDEPAIAKRKADHLEVAASGRADFKATTLLEHVHLIHQALPELAVDEIDLATAFVGKQLRAPLLITGMTGGTPEASAVNRDLARAAQAAGIAFGVGSQRAMDEHPELADTYQVRDVAPDVVLLGNLGGVQALALGPARIVELAKRIGADALAIHLNPGQELIQAHGDRDFRGVTDAIARLVDATQLPIVVKETGCGLSVEAARALAAAGVDTVDVAGAGGTSWVAVEAERAAVGSGAASLGQELREWGLPTAVSVVACVRAGQPWSPGRHAHRPRPRARARPRCAYGWHGRAPAARPPRRWVRGRVPGARPHPRLGADDLRAHRRTRGQRAREGAAPPRGPAPRIPLRPRAGARVTAVGWGKIILLGEHAVVYGYPALAAALDRGVTIAPVPTPAGGPLRLDVPAWELKIRAGDDHPVAHSLCAIADSLGVGRPALSLIGDAQIPHSAGLGSSAALAVAIARALLAHARRPPEPATVGNAAGASETLLHGRASGIDVALALAGGIGVYRKSAGLRPIAARGLRVLVGPSGTPRSTAAMVERIADATHALPADERLAELGGLTDAGTTALLAGDLVTLGTAMDRAHEILAGLGVSTPQLDSLCQAARATGAHGAKLTGAGGGGAIIAIAPRDREAAILAEWRSVGVTGFVATVGAR